MSSSTACVEAETHAVFFRFLIRQMHLQFTAIPGQAVDLTNKQTIVSQLGVKPRSY